MQSPTESVHDGCVEVLSLSEYQSKYEFLKEIESDNATSRFEINAEGYPQRLIHSCTLLARQTKYDVHRVEDVVVCMQPVMYYLLLIWEQPTDNGSLIWVKTHGPHDLRAGSVVQLSKVRPELEGFFRVECIAMETGVTEGITLFTLSHTFARLGASGSEILWQYGAEMDPGECISQFEIDPQREPYVQISSTPVIPEVPAESAVAAEETEKPSGSYTIPPEILEKLSSASCIQPQPTCETPSDDADVSVFNGFPTMPSPAPSLRSGGPYQSAAFGSPSDGDAPGDSFSFFGTLLSDAESEENDAIEEIPEAVSFLAEEFGMTELDCSRADVTTMVASFTHCVQQKLFEVGRIVGLILFNDPVGTNFVNLLTTEISQSIQYALMMKGDSVCLVPQKLYGAVHRAMQKLDVSYQFYGGVLLHICDTLERIYREQQFNLARNRLESSPANPFEHMLNSGNPRITYPLSVMDHGKVLDPVQMPHLASRIKQPDISSLTDEQVKSLFINAPYLMKNEISNPKFLNKMKDYVGQRASGPMRRYQELCLEKFLSGGNYVFVAPTGAGKTKIFVECSRKLLETNRTATIVVICSSVPLATQQACVYVVERFLAEAYWVNTFSSDNSLKPCAWRHLTATHNVMILTPQVLLNVMDFYKKIESFSVFDDIDLLILDECHHVRKQHAYNKIMTAYRATPKCKTQVIGFTASPTKSPDVAEGEVNLEYLLDQMQARCVVLSETNPEVQQHVPSAKEETAYAEEREEDVLYARHIGRLLYRACQRYIAPLVGRVGGVLKLPDQSLNDMGMGLMSSNFENWAKLTVEKLSENEELSHEQRTDYISTVELLRACNNSLDLVNDTGFESSLKVLAQRMAEIASVFNQGRGMGSSLFPNVLAGVYCSKMIQSISHVLQSYGMSPYPSSYVRFPRFIQLVQFLERYKNEEELHGMVFVKTRDGVYHLAKMLRLMPSMKNTFVFEFTGHGQGNKKKSQMPIATSIETLRGMSGAKQQEVLDQFCRSGRHILCATSAAEEGINVTTCQFVVRYSVTYTGIQRVQSRGRSRVSGGIFFNIIQKDSKEAKFLEKSQREEANMNTVLKQSERVEHI